MKAQQALEYIKANPGKSVFGGGGFWVWFREDEGRFWYECESNQVGGNCCYEPLDTEAECLSFLSAAENWAETE